MEDLIAYFDDLPFHFDQSFYNDISAFREESLKKGDYFVKESERVHKLSFIVRGKIRHFYNIDGVEFTRWVSLSQHFVTAFTSFVRQTPSLENLECIESCMLYTIDRSKFYALMNKHSPA